PRRLPPRAPARRAAVPRGSAGARAARRRVLADLLSEALQQPALVAERSVRSRARRVDVDALVDLHAAYARDRPAARSRRCRRSPPSVAAGARARVPAREPGLLQLLREHGQASALPVREPARALRPLVGRRRGPAAPRRAANCTTARSA